jgi:alpha-mannosidase/mannosylglycerate hydrolase
MVFEDGTDIGDGWYHAPAVNDQHFTSQASSADVAIVANGPLRGALRVRVTLKLPVGFDFARSVRIEQLTKLVIENIVALRAGQDFLEVETKATNTVKDHRLRVLFPSGARSARTFLADSAFDVVERPIALRDNIHINRELEVESKPQQTWTAVHDTKRGLAVVCDGGLLESGVRDVSERPVILTLFRSTCRTVMTTGEPEGQLLGHSLSFRYRIVPLTGSPDLCSLFDRAQELGGGLRSIQLEARDLTAPKTIRCLPPSGSLLEISGDIVLASIRRLGGTLEMRAFNPHGKKVSARLKISKSLSLRSAQKVNFESKPTAEKTRPKGPSVPVVLQAKEIQTLSFK